MGLCGCEFFSPKPDNENVSQGLEYESLGDGTCCVSGIGSCTDTEIVIPSTSPEGDIVTSIGNSAFYRCYSLTSVVIPDSVTSIGDDAFFYCSSLTSVVIGDSVTSIGDCAFFYCSSLTSVVIPDSVTTIDNLAFSDCYRLKDVYYTGSKAEWQAITIDSGNFSLKSATKHYNYVPEN